MIGSDDSHLAEARTKAAYANAAVAHVHGSGDHASAENTAWEALGYSVEAVKRTKEVAKSAL